MLYSKPVLSHSKIKFLKNRKDFYNLNFKIMEDKNSLNSISFNEQKSKEDIMKDLCSPPTINIKENMSGKQENISQLNPNNIYNDFIH